MRKLRYHVFPTPIGWAAALVSEKGLCALTVRPSPQEALDYLGPQLSQAKQDPDALEQVQSALEEYFKGTGGALQHLTLDMGEAPPFFKAAWEACRTIAPGETRSYGWLARAIGRPRAPRAAGRAMARNPIALAIPCHRVIGSDGGLHGYGMGGLSVKAKLLELEGYPLNTSTAPEPRGPIRRSSSSGQ